MSAASRRGEQHGMSDATRVLLGLGLGILTGVFFGEAVGFLKVGGDAFIALLQITVLPYILVALITSIGRQTPQSVKALALNAGSLLLGLWALGLLVVLSFPLALPEWPSASFFSTSQLQDTRSVDFLQLYIPSNIFSSLANATVPAIVVFSVLFGLGLMNVANKELILTPLSTIGDTLMAITGYVGRLAPYGVFALTASAAGTIDVGDLSRLQVYLVLYVVISLLLTLWVIPRLIAALTPLSYGAVIGAFRAPLITAFATGNLLLVLPMLAANGKELLRQTQAPSDFAREQEESSVDILLPAAFSFPTLGTILSLMFVLFGGWYIGSTVSPAHYPTLASVGLATLFGGTVLALPFLFDLLRLPADLFQVFLALDVVASRFGTTLAAMHLIAIALIGTCAATGALRFRLRSLLRFTGISVGVLAVALLGVRAFYTYVYVAPYTTSHLLEGLPLRETPQSHVVYREAPQDASGGEGLPGSARFRARGVLRACYQPDDYPSAFFNDAGELVGFDVEMTHRFAHYIDIPVEFWPFRHLTEAEERLKTGQCDVIMSLVPITPAVAEKLAMTAPVLNLPVGMVVKDHQRGSFQKWADIRAMAGLRVAVQDNPATPQFLARVLPNATSVLYQEKQKLDEMLAAGAPDIDSVLTTGEKGAAWTIRYPGFDLVSPSPALFLAAGYAVARGDTETLLALDTWLLNAKGNGTIDTLYRYWMLGQVQETQPPRWSIIRDVLGWMD
jgi:Na+/H+-dicarboxylate symporter/ABC-type amino acid transport substrate-binding protein